MSSSLRRALLGAVAFAAVAGVAGRGSSIPAAPVAAIARRAIAAPSAGPASFADIVDRVEPAVVSVKVKIADSEPSDDQDSRALARFPAGQPVLSFLPAFRHSPDEGDRPPEAPSRMAQGSGFFIYADGYIVTNNHVVDHAERGDDHAGERRDHAGQGDRRRHQDRPRAAQGAGATDFPFVDFAAKPPRVGDWVIAVGNPFGLGGTVTAGIVSARGRDIGSGPYDDFLQIDAPVNRGNSGGPTFNAQGEVVGVNTAIFSPSGGSVGIGFAIASESSRPSSSSSRTRRGDARLDRRADPAVTQEIADSLGLKSAAARWSPKSRKIPRRLRRHQDRRRDHGGRRRDGRRSA